MSGAGAGGMRLTVGVLSHKRPHLLARVLTGLAQQDISGFEIVIAGDLSDLGAFDLPENLASGVRYFQVTEPNICHARNKVVSGAGGDIVAFCDDDAVPEPDWLRRIAEPFTNPRIGAVGGLVRARDGLKVEWYGTLFDRSAREFEFDVQGGIQILSADDQIRTERFGGLMGANSAFRRAAVAAVGGFDEAYRYFLDETDMALRLTEAGWDMAITDAAEVHHLREVNAVRGHLRKPRNLEEVAASKAYFCARHLDGQAIEPEFARFRARRAADCDGFIRSGAMRGAERDRLLAQVDAGLAEGRTRTPVWHAMDWFDSPAHTQWSGAECGEGCLNIAIKCGWGYGRARRLIRLAEDLVRAGHRASVFRFQTGVKARNVVFRNGVWIHEGGTWRLDHRSAGERLIRRSRRIEAEIARVHDRRAFDVVLAPGVGGADRLMCPGTPALSIEVLRRGYDANEIRQRLISDLSDVCRSCSPHKA